MRTKQLTLVFLFVLGLIQSASAQWTVVGYVNLSIYAGKTLIANPLYTTDNSLSMIFPVVPDGSTLTKWNPLTLQYLPLSTYTSGSGWNINYDLAPGEGALFNAPSTFTNTFVGGVLMAGDGPLFTPPSLGEGVFLVSSTAPMMSTTFQQLIGRDPVDGESVRRLDVPSQLYYTTTYQSGAWNNGVPAFNMCESAFFTLGSGLAAPVPEPGVFALAGLGAFLFFGLRRCRTHSASQK